MKAPVRSRSIGTKVTEEEYARLEAQAAERKQSLSEWSREAMLSAAESGTGTPASPHVLRYGVRRKRQGCKAGGFRWPPR